MVKALGTVHIAHDRKTCFGASPFWDSDASTLIYVDVTKRSIYRFSPKRCEIQKYKDEEAERVSFAIPLEGCPQDYVVGADDQLKLVRWSPDKTAEIYRQHGGAAVEIVQLPWIQRIATGAERATPKPSPKHFNAHQPPFLSLLSICEAFPRWESIDGSEDAESSVFESDSNDPYYGYGSDSVLWMQEAFGQSDSEYELEPYVFIEQDLSTCCSSRETIHSDGEPEGTSQDYFGRGSERGCSENDEEATGSGGERRGDDTREAIPVPSREADGQPILGRVEAGYGNCDEQDLEDESPPLKATQFQEDQEANEVAEEGEEKQFEAEDVTLVTLDEPEGNYLKIGKVDTCGRLWLGTSGPQNGDQVGCVEEAGLGNIYGVTWQRQLRVKIPSISQSAGMAWSPDNRTLYVLDAAESCIFAYDFHEKTGTVSCPRAIFDTAILGRGAVPHGLTIDNDGYLYVGIYGLGKVIIVDPESRKLAGYICIPTPYVTGLTWGGEMLDTLYVTTAALQADLARHPKSGNLFQVTNLKARGFKNLKANIIP